jgi:hypothetical protein
MYEVDFLPIQRGTRSGDAITMRFALPNADRFTHVIIDGGFLGDGEAVVEHVREWYGTEHIDIVISTHPDGDHLGGLGTVVRELEVESLLIHDLAGHGGGSLPAAKEVDSLMTFASQRGVAIYEPFTGVNAFNEALVIAGPDPELYDELVAEQVEEERSGKRATVKAKSGMIAEAVSKLSARALTHFPIEVPFGDAGGDNPRNQSSAIVDVALPGRRFLFTSDAGVRGLDPAVGFLDSVGRTDTPPTVVQVPHHGSRHNVSSQLLDRMLGAPSGGARGSAFVSISTERAEDPRYPSPRVTNAFGRRGFKAFRGKGITSHYHGDGAPDRGWTPMEPIPPLDESIDDR